MGFMDSAKDALNTDDLADKAKDLAGEHKDKIHDAVDSAADAVDEKTGGRFSEHIEKGADMAKDQTDNL